MYCAVVVLCLLAAAQASYKNPNTAEGRTAMVHLFEWPWRSIADECENFLAPHGFGGVQVSPPNEHRIIYQPYWDTNVKRPWYESYQPISYKLTTRRGTRGEFIDMVQRCNNVGVRIYVDAVVNHMCGEDAKVGEGSANSPYDTENFDFSGVPYSPNDFNQPRGMCTSGSGQIENYGDVNQVRNCNLVGLLDLATSESYVRNRIADYFNDVIDIGVAGFRIDAAKHMWPADIEAIFGMTNDLNKAYFPANTRPFVYQEVIDKGGEPVQAKDYKNNARVTDFIYGGEVSATFRGHKSFSELKKFGTDGYGVHWDLSDNDALVFIDNHDNQRGHGGGGDLLTHRNGNDYKLAIAFMLSWPHGFPRIMSSYKIDQDWTGPPHNNDWSTKDPTFNSDGSCISTDTEGWVCEHRWRAIKNMVEWRNQAGNEPVQNFWGDYSRVAFSRGNRAFIAIGRGGSSINEQLQTGLPAGEYCNLAKVDYDSSAQSCTGYDTVNVDSSGYAYISVSGSGEDTLVFIHVGATKNGPIVAPSSQPTQSPTQGPTSSQGPQPTAPAGWERTVIFIYKPTSSGQDLFVGGGIDHSRRNGCTNQANSNNNCAMPIAHNTRGSNTKFNDWKTGDDFLDWYGAESDQGNHNGQSAEGSPLVWTTNDAGYHANVATDGYGYTALNQWGEHYWLLDINMDCSKTEEGWFELKGIMNGNNWENDRSQGSCSGSAGGSAPYSTGNHFARCGYLNKFTFDSNDCQIDYL